MSPETATILAAVAAPVLGGLGWLAVNLRMEWKVFRNENHEDHGRVVAALDENNAEIKRTNVEITKLGDRLNGHIDWHVKGKK